MSKLLTKVAPPQGQAGHFRVGDVTLQIPPEQIQCHKVINNQEVLPLRFPFSIPIKTGQSRWDVTWTWKALADRSVTPPDYKQWTVAQRILAMFKCAPFVEVENDHLRQILFANPIIAGNTKDDRMAFALRQLRIDTIPDLVDGLQLTITMSLFNYKPYSSSFAYQDENGNPVSASHSPSFTAYIDNWIAANLDNDPTQLLPGEGVISDTDWVDEVPGTTQFSWREYKAISLAPNPPVSNPNGTPSSTTPSSNPKKDRKGKQHTSTLLPAGGYADNVIITDFTPTNPQIATLVQAIRVPETAGGVGYNSPALTLGISSALGILQWLRKSAITAMQESDKLFGTGYIAAAVQSKRLLNPTGKTYAWNNNVLGLAATLSSNPAIANYWNWMSSPTGHAPCTRRSCVTGQALVLFAAWRSSLEPSRRARLTRN